eukprot:scaffold37787_cov153-Skeletonema_marinoi.AAC.1
MTSLITQRYLRLTYSANLAARIYIIHTSHLHCGRLIPFSNLARDRIHSSLEKPAPSFCELSLKHTVHNDAQVQYCKCHTQDKYENEQSQLQLLNNVPSMSITTTFTSFYSPVLKNDRHSHNNNNNNNNIFLGSSELEKTSHSIQYRNNYLLLLQCWAVFHSCSNSCSHYHQEKIITMNNNQSPPPQSSSPMQQHSANMQQQQQPRHYLSRTVSNTSTSSSSSSQQTTTTAPNKRQRLRNRSVHFAPISNLFIVPTKSPQDIHASYYNEQDTVNFKREMSYSSQVMSSCPVVDVVEDIAYGLATESLDVMMIQARIRQLHPQERIFTRGIEHVVSSTVLKLMAHRRKDTSGHRCIGESMMMKTNMLDNRGLIGIIFDCKVDPKEILR